MTFLEIFKIIIGATPTVIFGILLACIAYFVLPNNFLISIGINISKGENNPIGIALILSAGLIASHFVFKLSPFLGKEIRNRYYMVKKLNSLTADEKKFLKKYIKEDIRVQESSIYKGIHEDLNRFGIIYRSSGSIQPAYHTFEYSINTWAYNYLKKHTDLLDI